MDRWPPPLTGQAARVSTARLPVMHILTRYGGVAVRPSAAAGHCPACVTSATRWNVTRRPVNHRVPPPVKDLAVPGHDRGPSRWRIPAVAGVPRRCQQRRSGRPESDRAPPCMRWRDPARPRRAGWPVARPCRRRAPPAGARYPRKGPVSRLLPRSRGHPQGGARFRTVKTFLLPPRAPRKSTRPAISGSCPVHKVIHRKQAVIRIWRWLSTAYSQPIHRPPERKPENTGTAGAGCNRLSFSQRLSVTHLVTGSDVGTDGSR